MRNNNSTQNANKNARHVIHTHSSGEGGIFANSYLVETANGVVAVDAPLTVSESRAFRGRLDALGKPLLAVLITHPHPDHVAGITTLVENTNAEIIALAPVDKLMRELEEPKRIQWEPVFGEEWIPKWTFPNRLVSDGEVVSFDDANFRVYDIGAGGDSDANSIWVLENSPKAAFVGDLVFNQMHSYLADGQIHSWLKNLDKARNLLSDVEQIYPGHGASGSLDLLERQKEYLLAYQAAIRNLALAGSNFDDAAKDELERKMLEFLPDSRLSFLIKHSADAVARELKQEREVRV